MKLLNRNEVQSPLLVRDESTRRSWWLLLLGFLIGSLSPLRFYIFGNAFLIFDIIGCAVCIINRSAVLRIRGIPKLIGISVVSGILWNIQVLRGDSIEWPFYFRMLLCFCDGCALASLCGGPEHLQTKWKSALTLGVGAGFASTMAVWLIVPAAGQWLYINNLKIWLSQAPALLVVWTLLSRRKAWVVPIGFLCFGLGYWSGSRTLMLQTVVLVALGLHWGQDRRRILGFASITALGILLAIYDPLEINDLENSSNVIRQRMIKEVFSSTPEEWAFGMGINEWRSRCLYNLSDYSNAIDFFETANPHFLPVEYLIRGGIVQFALGIASFAVVMRNKRQWAIGVAILLGSLFSTTTGPDRIFTSLAIFLASTFATGRKQVVVSWMHLDPRVRKMPVVSLV